MPENTQLLTDTYLSLMPAERQREAATVIQDAFTRALRATVEHPAQERRGVVDELLERLVDWQGSGTGEGVLLHQAVTLLGLDQWGQAYTPLVGAGALTGLSELVGALRDRLENEAACQVFFQNLAEEDEKGFTFKVQLHSALHVALWHAAIAESDAQAAQEISTHLGGLMLGLFNAMPRLGWVVVAKSMADIQTTCLEHGLAQEGLAQSVTQQLFASLAQQMPEGLRQQTLAGADEMVQEWSLRHREASASSALH